MVSSRGRDRRSQARPRSSSDGRGRGRPLTAIAVIVLGSSLVLFGLDPFGLVGDAQRPGVDAAAAAPSGTAGAAPSGSAIPAIASPAPPESQSPAPPPIPGHEVYGFVPYWEMDAGIADHVAKTDLSTLALFSVTHRSSGRMQDSQIGYKRITGKLGQRLIREAHKRGTRVELVYTSFGESKNRAFYASDKAQRRWIKELVDFTEEQGFDGINVDVELLPVDLVPAYGAWVGRLRTALRERLPDAQVSVSTTSGPQGAAMALAANAAGADRIFLMGYDYHWAGSEPGASAPLDGLDGEDRDLVRSLDHYAAIGVPVERTILGLPLYGNAWPVSGPGFGAPSVGRGDTWVPRRNLRVLKDASFEPEYNTTESTEFYAVPGEDDGTWNAVYYDSPRSLTPKLALADDRGLAGAGFWAIGYERGLPRYTKLIAKFAAGELRATKPAE